MALNDCQKCGLPGGSYTTHICGPLTVTFPVAEQPPSRRCEKCGESKDLLVRWHGAGAYHDSRKHAVCHGDFGPRRGNPTGEHLHVTCRTCQFDWFEDTLDNLGGGS